VNNSKISDAAKEVVLFNATGLTLEAGWQLSSMSVKFQFVHRRFRLECFTKAIIQGKPRLFFHSGIYPLEMCKILFEL
jgi:hypothetical protein